ncbi:baseplate wedge subunit [Yersinia phage fHe-Yen9-02]|nr:baseplate wedge subunit [Yersinia phage fHe-Yen9-02]
MASLFKTRVNLPPDQRTYSDIHADIKIQLLDTVQDIDSITQKILFIIGTRKGSRKWREKFGSNVYSQLFEPFDQQTAGWIQTYIRTAIEDPDNGLTDDVTDVNCLVVADSATMTFVCSVSWRCPKLEQSNSINFAMRSLA